MAKFCIYATLFSWEVLKILSWCFLVCHILRRKTWKLPYFEHYHSWRLPKHYETLENLILSSLTCSQICLFPHVNGLPLRLHYKTGKTNLILGSDFLCEFVFASLWFFVRTWKICLIIIKSVFSEKIVIFQKKKRKKRKKLWKSHQKLG